MKHFCTFFLFLAIFCVRLEAQTIEGISKSYTFNISKEPPYCEKPKAPANLVFEKVDFQDANGNGIIEAGEICTLQFELVNTGKGHGCTVQLTLKETGSSGLQMPASTSFAELPPGDRKSIKFTVQGSMNQKSMATDLTLTALEKNGFDADPVKVSVNVQAFQEPKLEVVDYKFSSPSGSMSAGSGIDLKVVIQNLGKGLAEKVKVKIKLPEANVFISGEEEYSIDSLRSGDNRMLDFQFVVNKRYEGATVPCKILLTEKFGKYGQTKEVSVVMNQVLATPKTVVVKPKELTNQQNAITQVSLTSDVDKNLPKTGMKRPDAMAVVIGNKNYTKTKPVDYALNDAFSMRNYLVEVLGFEDGNIIYQTDANLDDFYTIFGKENGRGMLADRVKKDISDVFVFYSGHGAPELGSGGENKGYIVPVTCNPNYVAAGGYALETLYGNLEKLQAKSLTVVLDACFSGADLIEQASPMVIKPKFPALKTAVVLASSKETELSNWYAEEQHGMFTYFFLKAIQNKEQSDANKDAKLTLEEIYNYVSHQSIGVPYYSRRLFGSQREQNPMLLGKDRNRVLVEFGK
jgi:hypothetical protein